MVYSNPLFVATADDRLDVLRVLLDLADSNKVQLQPDGPWDTSLLDVACEGAQLNTVRFLLDRSPPLGARYASDSHGGSALLSAAYSLSSDLCYSPDPGPDGRKIWLRDEIARSEEIVCMLLDRGASVRDAVRSYRFPDDEQDEKPMSLTDTALGRAVSRASYKLESRLIAEGADVHARQYGWGGHPVTDVREVTALHVASGYWNVQGIKALLDNCGEIASQICDTLELLIQSNPTTINAQGEDGATPLFSTIRGHADCGGTKHLERMVRLLYDKGADAGIRDISGQNVLHVLAVRTTGGQPVNPLILDLLVAHGAKVNNADSEGNTPLHHMARSLRQMNLIRRLIHHGAKVNATNTKGETPLHRAMAALLMARQNRDGTLDAFTPERRAKAHDEVLEILQEAGCRMDQPNAEGKTPYQLLDETRESWRKRD